MKQFFLRIVAFIRRKLATRLGLWIALFAALIFVLALGFMFMQSRKTVRLEAISHATQTLDNTVLRVNGILEHVQVATDNTDWLIPIYLNSPDSMFSISRRILENNDGLNGCSISFEPYFFRSKGRWFSAFSLNEGDAIETIQEGNDEYEYFYFDWYQQCKLLDEPCWTEPYVDYNPQGITSSTVIASYCKPIRDLDDKYVGTISVDLSLGWLSETISAVKPYPNSYSIMIGEGGTYFVHPDSTKLFYQTIFTETLDHPDPKRTALGHAMQRGEEGMQQLDVNGEPCYVFYKPLGITGWSVAIVCPEGDIFSGYYRLARTVIAIVLVGLLLMFLTFRRIVGKELVPLQQLAGQAMTIASGAFDTELPDYERVDEIGQLGHSFSEMQHSLVQHIAELKKTTAQKASIESELNVARDIQMSMVPTVFPQHNKLDMYAEMNPAKEVGGDLYSYVMQGDRLYFCLGDVSGKGVPASLFMAQSVRLFHTLATEGMTPADIAIRMNNELSEGNDRCMFVTMFIGMLQLDTGRLDFCNCGHNPPVMDGQFLKMQYTNQPIGLLEGIPYMGETIADIRGKMLLVYTDGLNEAENPQKELLGDDRLLELMADTQSLSPRAVIDKLKAAVEKHRDGADPNDDLTLMCLKIA